MSVTERFRLLVMVAVCAGALAGCGLTNGDAGDTGADVPVRYGKAKPAAPTGNIVVEPPKKPAAPARPAAPAETAAAPVSLIGQSLQEVEQTFGTPHGVRDEKPALIYEYGTTTCSLSVVFFMDIERKQFRALSYDVRAAGDGKQTPEACLRSIRGTRSGS
ncbi:MAG: hypothetical protein JJ900_13280 [Rhodospirillales bacterium]|nr:hypothetical protein [Rhodospirillales bacterium]MBO6787817.1 hypothetical protein [Rhodospirillales bacterium]